MPWLKLKEGQTVNATIDLTTTKSLYKHWLGDRSELCIAPGCPLCNQGLPKRRRYQATLIIDSTPHNWEFGEQVMAQLHTIPHETHWAHITITRLGDSRNTRYQISHSPSPQPAPQPQNKYIGGKYGHLVHR